LSNQLRRLAPNLRALGIAIDFGLHHHPRTIHIHYDGGNSPSPATPPSPGTMGGAGDAAPSGRRGDAGTAGMATSPPSTVPVATGTPMAMRCPRCRSCWGTERTTCPLCPGSVLVAN
jgi:hypothetical protein